MKESLDNARTELRRAEHILYVSLKYTRTVDVLKNIIDRLINSFTFGMEALLIYLKEKKKIDDVPSLPRLRIDLINKSFGDNEYLMEFIEFYKLLRRIKKAKFERALEYRRYVHMTAYTDDGEVQVDIDIVGDYYKKLIEFINFVSDIVYEVKKE